MVGSDRRPYDVSLTDTQRAIRAAAAQHPEQLVSPPEQLPAGARQKMAQALLKQDLVIGVHRPAYDAIAKWTVEGEEMLLKITTRACARLGWTRTRATHQWRTRRPLPRRRHDGGRHGAHGRGERRAGR